MRQRIISGAVIGVLIVVLGLTGGYPLAGVLLFCALVGYHELLRACSVIQNNQPNALEWISWIMTAVLYIGLMSIYHNSHDSMSTMLAQQDYLTGLVLVVDFLVTMIVYVLTFPKFKSTQVMPAFFSFVYCPVLMSYIFRARSLNYGIVIYALIFVCSSICDVFALVFGMAFGKHKMAPVLSPKKTVEGGIGGVASSVVAAAILAVILHAFEPRAHYVLEFMLIGLVGAFISMMGDLAASAIKRNHNIKDYGKLIPGHGGIMDRFDSIIFCAPVIYFMGLLLLDIAA